MPDNWVDANLSREALYHMALTESRTQQIKGQQGGN